MKDSCGRGRGSEMPITTMPSTSATGSNGIVVILRTEAIQWEKNRERREQEEREKANSAPPPILAPAGRGRQSIQPSWKIVNRRVIQPYPTGPPLAITPPVNPTPQDPSKPFLDRTQGSDDLL